MFLYLLACVAEEEPVVIETDFTSAEGTYAVTAEPDPTPPLVGAAMLHITTEPMAEMVHVSPWMPAHDHGVSEEPAVSGEHGHFMASWEYPMAGEWEITLHLMGEHGDDMLVITHEVQ